MKTPLAPRVGFFVTCLADLFRPTVGFASVKLLIGAGCRVDIPEGQTCCGQMAYNSGDTVNARALAKQVMTGLAEFDYVVAPSGSCTAMIKRHYLELFAGDPEWGPRAKEFSGRCFELTSFLADIRAGHAAPGGDAAHGNNLLPPLPVKPICHDHLPSGMPGTYTYHDSCIGLRELGIHSQPRTLLRDMAGIGIREMEHLGVCCGFGGTFCLKYPEISTRMVDNKVAGIRKNGADMLLGGDLGCLFNIAGRLKRLEDPCGVYHVAEVLAGMVHVPGPG